MASERLDNVKEYYRRITEVDIGLIARELLGERITYESDRLSGTALLRRGIYRPHRAQDSHPSVSRKPPSDFQVSPREAWGGNIILFPFLGMRYTIAHQVDTGIKPCSGLFRFFRSCIYSIGKERHPGKEHPRL
jgi:hypothetical protein